MGVCAYCGQDPAWRHVTLPDGVTVCPEWAGPCMNKCIYCLKPWPKQGFCMCAKQVHLQAELKRLHASSVAGPGSKGGT